MGELFDRSFIAEFLLYSLKKHLTNERFLDTRIIMAIKTINSDIGRIGIKPHYEDEPKVYTSNFDKPKTIQPGYNRVWQDVEEPKQVLALPEI